MGLALFIAAGCGLWADELDTGTVDDGYFHPDEWGFEAWGYYDGQTLGEFQFNDGSSSAIPAYVLVNLRQGGLSCGWIGALTVEGAAALDADQWVGFTVSLDMTWTDCEDLDPQEWGAGHPDAVLGGLSMGLAWKDMTDDLDQQIQNYVGPDNPAYEQQYVDYAFTQILGLQDPDSLAWTAFDVGPAFTYLTDEAGVLAATPDGLVSVLREDDLLEGVVSGASLVPRPLSEITPFIF